MTEQKHVLIAGSIAFDNSYDYRGSFSEGLDREQIDDLSVCFTVSNHHVSRGGAGANMAWTLALLGRPVSLLAATGPDGARYVQSMQARGVDTSAVTVYESGSTPHLVIASDDKERQIAFFDSGVEGDNDSWLAPDKVNADIGHALVGPWQPVFAIPVFEWCKQKDIPCLFDPGQHVLDYSLAELRNVLRMCAGLIVNAYEWHLIRQRSEWSLYEIMEHVPFVVVTQSERGFHVHQHGDHKEYPACTSDRVVNPTGAGDAFRAGLLAGLHDGWDLETSCKLGAAIASRAVEVEGAQLPSIDKKQLKYRLKNAYGIEPSF